MNKHQQEFIGKKVEILHSKNIHQKGIIGKIINETKNTFTVSIHEKKIVVLKKDKIFKIDNDKIDGNKITKKPEERIKIK